MNVNDSAKQAENSVAKWSKAYDQCIKCGLTSNPYCARGLCSRCYHHEWAQKHGHRKTRRKKRANQNSFSLFFTEHICTPKKLIPVVIYRLYPDLKMSIARKAEMAKQYIRNLLCENCKAKYISNWKNDFETLDGILCVKCAPAIKRALDKAVENQSADWFIKLQKCLGLKRKAIQYELELRFNKPFEKIAKEWHISRKLSAIAMQELLLTEYKMHISARDMQRWLGKLGIIRSHIKALRNRVVMGRMKYSERNIDYSKRVIDYAKIQENKKNNIQPPLKRQCIRLPAELHARITELAHQRGRTISEVVRDMLALAENVELPNMPKIWQKLHYVMINYRKKLMCRQISGRKGRPIILISTPQ